MWSTAVIHSVMCIVFCIKCAVCFCVFVGVLSTISRRDYRFVTEYVPLSAWEKLTERYVCVYTYICTYISMYSMYVCIYVQYVRMYVCMCVCTVCMYVCMYSMYVCMYSMYVCMYVQYVCMYVLYSVEYYLGV